MLNHIEASKKITLDGVEVMLKARIMTDAIVIHVGKNRRVSIHDANVVKSARVNLVNGFANVFWKEMLPFVKVLRD